MEEIIFNSMSTKKKRLENIEFNFHFQYYVNASLSDSKFNFSTKRPRPKYFALYIHKDFLFHVLMK